MAINIYIVKEDLVTKLPISWTIDSIESDDDFYVFKAKAKESGCYFIPTIDAYGDTVINELQIDPLVDEIKKLCSDSSINQKTLATLQQAVDAAKKSESHYILFVGD